MRFVSIINKKIPVGNALNVASHMMAGLVSTLPQDQQPNMDIINYGQDHHSHIASKWPHIMLKAKNSNKIKQLIALAKENNIHFVTFVSTMITGSWEEQIKNTQAVNDNEAEYYGIAMFGDDAILRSLTEKFSLYA